MRQKLILWLKHKAVSCYLTRRHVVLAAIFMLAAALIGRAAFLQLYQKDFLQEEGNDRAMRTLSVPALRGMILDRNGEVLAVSSPVTSIWADPKVLMTYQAYFPQIADALQVPFQEFLTLMQGKKDKRFVWLKRQLSPVDASKILRLNIPGIYSEREYRRFYADAEVTSHLLGFTDVDDQGQEGIERSYNSWLTGVTGKKRVLRDRRNRIIEEIETVTEAEDGKNLTLTIDRRLQYIAYRALKAAVLKHNAEGGTLVLADARTGDILAMVNQPAGNPNDRTQRKAALLKNRALTDTFEPGSTVKPFVIAVGLETGKWHPNSMIETSPGRYNVGKNIVRDIHNYGLMDVTTVMTKSSNIGVTKIAQSYKPELLWSFYHQLGIGQKSELNYPGEQPGFLSHYSKWKSPFEYATKTFGYGLTSNAVEIAQAYSVLANDGIKKPLRLVKDQPVSEPVRILSAKTTQIVVEMMETVVTKGSGKRAAIAGFRAAGKSGTARKVINGKYSPNVHRGFFAGLAPVSDPRYVLVVMIDEPKSGEYYGGLVAAPVFAEVMGGALRLLGVEPDSNNQSIVMKARTP